MTEWVKPSFYESFFLTFMNSWYNNLPMNHSFWNKNMFFNEDTKALRVWHISWSPQVLHSSLWVREATTEVAVYIGKVPCLDFKFILPYGASHGHPMHAFQLTLTYFEMSSSFQSSPFAAEPVASQGSLSIIALCSSLPGKAYFPFSQNEAKYGHFVWLGSVPLRLTLLERLMGNCILSLWTQFMLNFWSEY